jgi:hypothetical protein
MYPTTRSTQYPYTQHSKLHRLRWQVDGTGSGLCRMTPFGIRAVDISSYVVTLLVMRLKANSI